MRYVYLFMIIKSYYVKDIILQSRIMNYRYQGIYMPDVLINKLTREEATRAEGHVTLYSMELASISMEHKYKKKNLNCRIGENCWRYIYI